MRCLILFSFTLIFSTLMRAQEEVWTEDFGSGCNTGSSPGIVGWTVTSTGTNQAEANTWFVSAAENGQGAGNCGAGCGNNRTLHVGNVAIPLFGLSADNGAAYNAGGACGLFYCVATNRRADSPVIDLTGFEDLTLSFNYLEGGSGVLDNATLWFFNGSSWSQLVDLPKTTCCGGPCSGFNQGLWTAYSIALPPSATENPDIRIGFRWVNNDDGAGTDPSFAVDDIIITGTAVVPEPCIGDFNLDGFINTLDLLLFLTEFGCLSGCNYDITGDGIVNTTDLLLLLSVFGNECP